MKTSTKRFIVLLMLLCMLLSSLSNAIADDDDWYTYTYSYWGEEMASPNAFAVTNVIFPATLDEELGRFSGATSLFCIDDLVFVCDTKNNRIVELRKVEGVYELVRIIYTVQLAQKFAEAMTYDGAVDNTLFNPTDIFVKKVTLEDRLTNYGEYRGDPYVFPDEAKTEETPADGEEKKDETAGEEEQKEAEETPTPTPEGGDGGEATPTPTEAPKAPKERKANVVRQDLDREYDLYIADCQHCRVIHCDYGRSTCLRSSSLSSSFLVKRMYLRIKMNKPNTAAPTSAIKKRRNNTKNTQPRNLNSPLCWTKIEW